MLRVVRHNYDWNRKGGNLLYTCSMPSAGEGEFGYRGGKSHFIASSGVKTCSHSYKNEFDLQLEEDKFYTRYKQDSDVKSIWTGSIPEDVY